MSFFVADADALPLRKGCVRYACTYGVLHHLPDPGSASRRIVEILAPDGIYFASENNQSAFRAIFDWLMRLAPLWSELAGKEPLLSRQMIRDWMSGLPVDISYSTSVFLPPHAFNLLGKRLAGPVLRFSDACLGWLLWLGRQGGLLIFEARKRGATA